MKQETPLRLLFWNIRHGGGPTRTPELILAALEQRPDVLALAEFHGGSARGRGNTWHAPLADAGLTHMLASPVQDAERRKNGLFLASRFPLVAALPAHNRLLAVHVEAGTLGFALLAAHIASEEAAGARVRQFHEAAAWARAHAQAPALLVGDLNTSRTGMDLARPGQRHEALLGELWTAGLRDVWHAQGGSASQASWLGPNGEMHRIDTALASASLLARGAVMQYVFEPAWPSQHLAGEPLRSPAISKNAENLSDHAGILLELFTA